MKARTDFKTQTEYEGYMKIFYSGLAMASLIAAGETDEDTIAEGSLKVASATLKHVLGVAAPLSDNPPVIKEKRPKPHSAKSEIRELIDSAESVLKQKAYKSALTTFQNALDLDPANKYIQKRIELCQKWIKSLADLELAEEDKPFVKEKQKKEPMPAGIYEAKIISVDSDKFEIQTPIYPKESEFTTSFPPLE